MAENIKSENDIEKLVAINRITKVVKVVEDLVLQH